MAWLIARNPDLVVIQELTLNNAGSVVDRLKGALKYHHHAPKPGSFGIGIASRWPLEVVPLKGGGQPQLVATIETPTGPVRLVGVHVWPPLRRAWSHRQRSTLKRIGAQVTASEGPVIVAGDFNLTPWSPTFERFLESTDLRDPRVGRGLLATWSPASWSGFPLIPIDHILVSKEWKVGSLEVGPAFGSDHRPLIATLVR